jgi:hypothetical protein
MIIRENRLLKVGLRLAYKKYMLRGEYNKRQALQTDGCISVQDILESLGVLHPQSVRSHSTELDSWEVEDEQDEQPQHKLLSLHQDNLVEPMDKSAALILAQDQDAHIPEYSDRRSEEDKSSFGNSSASTDGVYSSLDYPLPLCSSSKESDTLSEDYGIWNWGTTLSNFV